MLKVILFDLDGTLLPMDTEIFIQQYIKTLTPKVAHILDPEKFVHALLAGTAAMMKDVSGTKTNENSFEEVFLSMTKLKKEEIWPSLEHFYDTEFPRLSHFSKPTPYARKIVEEAVNQGYKVAVATNPVFPKSAIYHRLKWADIDDLPFEMVTVYEDSLYTKPHLQYYQDICKRLSVGPSQCLMVGNHMQEDMVASSIGMKTFLVEGYVMDNGDMSYSIDERGTLEQLYQSLVHQKGLFSNKEQN